MLVNFCFILFTAGILLKVNGKMAKDMGWALNLEGGGCIEGNGHKALKAGMVSDNRLRPTPSMKVLGPTDCKMVTDQKHTLTEV